MDEINKAQVKEIIKQWILDMNKFEDLPEEIIALNFGLFEPYGIELIGSSVYDAEDDDWACEEDFVPQQRSCPALSIPDSIEWNTVLNTIVSILKELVFELWDIKLLHVKYITTGFSDGDLTTVKP